jgi:hypothetical protein
MEFDPQKHVSVELLNNLGRWGNQSIVYAAMRAYAEEYGCALSIPSIWPGNVLFGLCDSPILPVSLPDYGEIYLSKYLPIPPSSDEIVGHDFRGYAQYHTSWWSPSRKESVHKIKPTQKIMQCLDTKGMRTKWHNSGKTRIGMHIRRGDAGFREYHLTPISWYHEWLDKWWGQFNEPVLYMACEDQSDYNSFAEYHPYTTAMLETTLDPVWADWIMLRDCNVLVTGNSSFSFSAGLYSTKLNRFFRSNIASEQIDEEDFWNTVVLRQELVEDYPNVVGIRKE